MQGQPTICAQCGAPFIDPKHPNRKYCSQRCVGLSQRRRSERACEVCGKTFYPNHDSASGPQRFCSLACKGEAWHRERAKPKTPRVYHRRPEITKTCEHCGQTFTRPDWRVWREARYCSRDCYQAAWRALPESERARQTAAAHERVRGSKQSDEHRQKIARTVQDRCRLSGDEAAILAAYRSAGLNPTPLFAVHRYNIDFAFPDAMLAVEYNGGNWHESPKKREIDRRKSEYLSEQGWTILTFNRISDADDVSRIVEETRAALSHDSPKLL